MTTNADLAVAIIVAGLQLGLGLMRALVLQRESWKEEEDWWKVVVSNCCF